MRHLSDDEVWDLMFKVKCPQEFIPKYTKIDAFGIEPDFSKYFKGNTSSMQTTTSCKPFAIDDLNKAIEKIKALPPIPIRIKVSVRGYCVLLSELKDINIDCNLEHGYFGNYNGMGIFIADESENLEVNQGKIEYSDGSSKIITLFETKCPPLEDKIDKI